MIRCVLADRHGSNLVFRNSFAYDAKIGTRSILNAELPVSFAAMRSYATLFSVEVSAALVRLNPLFRICF